MAFAPAGGPGGGPNGPGGVNNVTGGGFGTLATKGTFGYSENALINNILGTLTPTLSQTQNTVNDLTSGLQLANWQTAYGNNLAGQGASLSQQQLGITQDQTNLQSQMLGTSGQYASALAGGTPANTAQGQLGMNQRVAQQQYGLTQQQLGIQQTGLGQQIGASGAANTTGQKQAQQSQNIAVQGAALSNAQTQAGFNYSEAQLNNQKQGLELVTQSNGISQQQVYNGLQQALSQSGLSQIMNAEDVLGQIGQAQSGGVSDLLQSFLPIASQYGVPLQGALANGGKK